MPPSRPLSVSKPDLTARECRDRPTPLPHIALNGDSGLQIALRPRLDIGLELLERDTDATAQAHSHGVTYA